MKNVFRWTIGNTSKEGLECLRISIKTLTKIYKDRFDYYVCYNNCNVQNLREYVGHHPVKIIKQDWSTCPLPIDEQKNIGTSLWKFCPSRININVHEIICDNDIVFIESINEIEEFLTKNVGLITEDPIKHQGKFGHLFDEDEKFNAGLVGLPPGYNLKDDLYKIWAENGSHETILQADEQGLISAALKKINFIKIPKSEIILIRPKGEVVDLAQHKKIDFFKKGKAYHFSGVNKKNHNYWDKFKKEFNKKLM